MENFFGIIRSYNGNSYNPTSIQFYYGFKNHFSVDYCKVNTANCAADEDTILTKCQDFSGNKNVVFPIIPQKQVNFDIDNYDYHNMPATEENVFIHICGYLLRRTFKKHFCDTCAILAQKDSSLGTCYLYLYFKAYNNEKDTFRNLYVPSVIFVDYIRKLQNFLIILVLLYKQMLCNNFQKFYVVLNFCMYVLIFQKYIY